jgi:uncharacterized protein
LKIDCKEWCSLKIGILGGSGFIGRHISRELREVGHNVVIFSRFPDKVNTEGKKGLQVEPWPVRQKLTDLDGVVNLAGETINQRWTENARRRILESRVQTAGQLAEAIDAGRINHRILITASAVGYYGTAKDVVFTEESGPGEGFLAEVCRKWEEAADLIRDRGLRVVKIRLGVVLGTDGGALPRIVLPYKMLAGGRVGSGEQWVSWIHIGDVTGLIRFALENDNVDGVLNATAPEPVRNDSFGRTVAKALHRPHWLPVPESALKLMFGDMSSLILTGQRVQPERTNACGYTFRYAELEHALQDLLGKR